MLYFHSPVKKIACKYTEIKAKHELKMVKKAYVHDAIVRIYPDISGLRFASKIINDFRYTGSSMRYDRNS